MFGKCALGLVTWPLAARGQKPVIFSDCVVNAASYSRSASSTSGRNLAVGPIASIFGTNLAAAAQTANTVPLPFSLGG